MIITVHRWQSYLLLFEEMRYISGNDKQVSQLALFESDVEIMDVVYHGVSYCDYVELYYTSLCTSKINRTPKIKFNSGCIESSLFMVYSFPPFNVSFLSSKTTDRNDWKNKER